MKNTNIEFLKKYNEMVINSQQKVMGISILPNNVLNNINAIVGSTLTAMNYDDREWTQTEIITDIAVKILFQHPLLDGNKRTAFNLLLTEAKADEKKIKEICDFLWNK